MCARLMCTVHDTIHSEFPRFILLVRVPHSYLPFRWPFSKARETTGQRSDLWGTSRRRERRQDGRTVSRVESLHSGVRGKTWLIVPFRCFKRFQDRFTVHALFRLKTNPWRESASFLSALILFSFSFRRQFHVLLCRFLKLEEQL